MFSSVCMERHLDDLAKMGVIEELGGTSNVTNMGEYEGIVTRLITRPGNAWNSQ